MKIFELLNPQAQNQLQDLDQTDPQTEQNPEDDSQGKFDANKVDQNLQDIAQNVDDQNAQPEPQGTPTEPPELDDQNVQPIDDALLQQVKNLPYVTKYNVKDKSPLSPMKISGMQVQDLSSLKDMVRFKIQNTMMKNQVGLADDPDMEYYSDLLRFVNTVMTFKKSNTKAQMAKTSPTPAYQTQNPSK